VGHFADLLKSVASIPAAPEALPKGAAVEVLWTQRIHRDALDMVTRQVDFRFPALAMLAYYCQRLL
jgi:hypothetical protein